MKPTTKAAFFAAMNPRDVHPTPRADFSNHTARSDWKTHAGSVVGYTESDLHNGETKFFLPQEPAQ
jgi:hypothetical protein